MASTLTKEWTESPYVNGTGAMCQLATSFVRKIKVTFAGGTTTHAVTSSDLGCANILDILSVWTDTAAAVPIVTDLTKEGFNLTVAANSIVHVFALTSN
jgi:hypothetical protein